MKKQIMPESFLSLEIPTALTADEEGKNVFFQFRFIKEETYHWMIRQYSPSCGKWGCDFEGSMPCISPDGQKLFYTKQENRKGTSLRIKNLVEETESCFGEFLRVREVCWSGDSSKVIFTAAVKERHSPKDLIDLRESIWIDRIKFKTDEEGLFDGTYREILIYDLADEQVTVLFEGKRDLSCPCFMEKDVIAYLGVPCDPDNSDEYYLYIKNLKTGLAEKYRGPGGPITRLAVSHDGKSIAVLAHDNLYWEAANFHIYVFDVTDKEWKCMTGDYDKTFGNCVDSDTGLENSQMLFAGRKNKRHDFKYPRRTALFSWI